MNHLRVVLQVHKEHKFFAKYSKCEFWLRSVTFLGHIICSERVEVDPRKTEAVKNCSRTLIPTVIRSVFNLASHYQKFVDGFASIASLLTTLTQKCMKFEWSEAC